MALQPGTTSTTALRKGNIIRYCVSSRSSSKAAHEVSGKGPRVSSLPLTSYAALTPGLTPVAYAPGSPSSQQPFQELLHILRKASRFLPLGRVAGVAVETAVGAGD